MSQVNALTFEHTHCSKYLSKGKKVAVSGSVSVRTYESNGKTRASLELDADEVEFLTPRGSHETTTSSHGYTQVDDDYPI